MGCGNQSGVRRLAAIVGLATIAGLGVTVLALGVAAGEPALETRIPHRDGTGRATIVEVDPGVPGARDFVEGEERPAPRRGELSVPSPTPRPAP
jgi:hypothetical protein